MEISGKLLRLFYSLANESSTVVLSNGLMLWVVWPGGQPTFLSENYFKTVVGGTNDIVQFGIVGSGRTLLRVAAVVERLDVTVDGQMPYVIENYVVGARAADSRLEYPMRLIEKLTNENGK